MGTLQVFEFICYSVTNLLNRACLDTKHHLDDSVHVRVETLGEINLSLSLSPSNMQPTPRRGSTGDGTSGDRSVGVSK